MPVRGVEFLHIPTRDNVLTVPLSRLQVGVEYAVEVGGGTILRVKRLDGELTEVGGYDGTIYLQVGDSIYAYSPRRGGRLPVAVSTAKGALSKALYWRGLYAAYVTLEAHGRNGGPPPLEEGESGESYLVVRLRGATVAVRAGSREIHRWGPRYWSGGGGGYLSPVYSTDTARGRVRWHVCLTCIAGFEWAVAFEAVRFRGWESDLYVADVITRNGLHTRVARGASVEVPGYGAVSLKWAAESAKLGRGRGASILSL